MSAASMQPRTSRAIMQSTQLPSAGDCSYVGARAPRGQGVSLSDAASFRAMLLEVRRLFAFSRGMKVSEKLQEGVASAGRLGHPTGDN